MTFALPLPPAKLTFVDETGAPLVGGTVAFYEPGTLTPKDTYQNYDATILNTNPVTLDARGQAIVWGVGRYRQIVKDAAGNTIWDDETAALTDRPYEAGFSATGTFAAGDELARWYFTEAVTFDPGFDGAFGGASPNPPSTTAFDITKNGVAIGAISVSTAGAVTISASTSPLTFAAGDFMSWAVQGGGAGGISKIAATFKGALNP